MFGPSASLRTDFTKETQGKIALSVERSAVLRIWFLRLLRQAQYRCAPTFAEASEGKQDMVFSFKLGGRFRSFQLGAAATDAGSMAAHKKRETQAVNY